MARGSEPRKLALSGPSVNAHCRLPPPAPLNPCNPAPTRILKHNERRVAAQLQRDALDCGARALLLASAVLCGGAQTGDTLG